VGICFFLGCTSPIVITLDSILRNVSIMPLKNVIESSFEWGFSAFLTLGIYFLYDEYLESYGKI
jgi:hypothetical protein